MKAIWLNEKVELVGPSDIAAHVVVRRSRTSLVYRGSSNLLVMTVSAGEITWADEEASVVVAAALLEPDLRRTWRLGEEEDDV